MRVLVFGDSITQGYWGLEGGWVAQLRKDYDRLAIDKIDDDHWAIFNLGVSADSSDNLLARIENETKARATEELAFVISIGVNDASCIRAGVNYSDPARYKQNLFEILKIARKYSDRILFVGLTPCVEDRTNPVSWNETCYSNARIKDFDKTLQDFCKENLLPFVKVFEPFASAEAKTELLPDGLHPNDEGHNLIADLVNPSLEKLLMKNI